MRAWVFAGILLACISVLPIAAQTTAFSYQGSLTYNGTPANGSFDFEFKLFDVLTGGTQIGSTIQRTNVVISNGVFAVALDFGLSPFSGADRFLEISARPTTCGKPPLPPCAFTTLDPRTQLLSAPYAIRALTVTGPVSATSATAGLSVSNDQPGISDPSPTNLPPAGLRAEATSSLNSNAGLIGLANGNGGFGVLGVTNGAGTAPQKTFGVVGLSTTTSGSGAGISGISNSPNSAAIEAESNGGGFIFNGKSSDPSSSNPKFSVTATGQVRANAAVFAKGFQSNSGFFGVNESGNLTAATVDTGILTTASHTNVGGALSVTGGISVGQGGIVNGLLTTESITVNGGGNGGLSVNGFLTVTGPKNNLVKVGEARSVLFYANESPEYWFEDFGTIKLRNGHATVVIDPTFAEATNTHIPYKVFLTPNGNTRGLYVTRKSATGFEVRENGRGRSNVTFDYRIVAKRKGYEAERFGPKDRK